MNRIFLRALAIGLLLVLGTQSSAAAERVRVSIRDNFFVPADVTIPQGQKVMWTHDGGPIKHNTAGATRLPLWNSGNMRHGDLFTYTFTAAATYKYVCVFHKPVGMIGTVSVPPIASPPSGPEGTEFTIQLATQDAPGGLAYDVQRKDPGGGFVDWMTGVTSATVVWDSSGADPGTYEFRSRMRLDSNPQAATDYSPADSVAVTA